MTYPELVGRIRNALGSTGYSMATAKEGKDGRGFVLGEKALNSVPRKAADVWGKSWIWAIGGFALIGIGIVTHLGLLVLLGLFAMAALWRLYYSYGGLCFESDIVVVRFVPSARLARGIVADTAPPMEFRVEIAAARVRSMDLRARYGGYREFRGRLSGSQAVGVAAHAVLEAIRRPPLPS